MMQRVPDHGQLDPPTLDPGADPAGILTVKIYVAAGPMDEELLLGYGPLEGTTLARPGDGASLDANLRDDGATAGILGAIGGSSARGSCRHLDVGSCRIYEVRWPWALYNPDANIRVVVEAGPKKSGPSGFTKPVVSPDGRFLAYSYSLNGVDRIGLYDLGNDMPAEWQEATWTLHSPASGDGPAASEVHRITDVQGYNPAWDPTGTRLWFNRTDPDHFDCVRCRNWSTLHYIEFEAQAGALLISRRGEHQFLTDFAFNEIACDMAWPSVDPVSGTMVAVHSSWSAQFQVPCPPDAAGLTPCDNGPPVPYDDPAAINFGCPWVARVGVPPFDEAQRTAVGVVTDPVVAEEEAGTWTEASDATALDPASWWPVQFDHGASSPLVDRVLGLAHLDWSPSGDQVIAFEQEGPGTRPPSPLDGPERGRLFAYRRDGNVFAPLRTEPLGMGSLARQIPPFDLRSDDDIARSLGIAGDPGCKTSLHKYPVFCGQHHDALEGADNYLVAMVACDADQQGPYVWSRVMLIDLADPTAPAYHDLTSLIEDYEHAPRNSYGGVMGDCGPWTRGDAAVLDITDPMHAMTRMG